MAWIDLEGAVNVRDVGGLPTVDGGETVYGRLLRSENLQELTTDDVAMLVGELGVTTVVDLRSTVELVTVTVTFPCEFVVPVTGLKPTPAGLAENVRLWLGTGLPWLSVTIATTAFTPTVVYLCVMAAVPALSGHASAALYWCSRNRRGRADRLVAEPCTSRAW